MQDRLLLLALSTALGVLHSAFLSWSATLLLVLLWLCLGGFFSFRHFRLRGLCLMGCMFFCGWLLHQLAYQRELASPPLQDSDYGVCGTLLYPLSEDKGWFSVEGVWSPAGVYRKVDWGLMLHAKGLKPGVQNCVALEHSSQQFVYGRWKVQASGKSTLFRPPGHAAGSLKKVRMAMEMSLQEVFAKFERVQSFLRLALLQSQDPHLAAMKADFRLAGLSHVLVASGFHVGLAGGVMAYLAAWLGAGLWARLAAFMVGAILFSLAAGLGPSLVRALMFAPLIPLGQGLDRRVRPARILALVSLFHMILFPGDLLSLGMVLSYGATLYLCLVPPWLQNRWGSYGALAGWAFLPVFMVVLCAGAGMPVSPGGVLGSFLAPLLTPILIWGFFCVPLGMVLEAPISKLNSLLMPLPEMFLGSIETLGEHFREPVSLDPILGVTCLSATLLTMLVLAESDPQPRGRFAWSSLNSFVEWALRLRELDPRTLSEEMQKQFEGEQQAASVVMEARRSGSGYEALAAMGPWQKWLQIRLYQPLAGRLHRVCRHWPLAVPEHIHCNPALRILFEKQPLGRVDLIRIAFMIENLHEELQRTESMRVYFEKNGLQSAELQQMTNLFRELKSHLPWLDETKIRAQDLLNCRMNWKRLDQIEVELMRHLKA